MSSVSHEQARSFYEDFSLQVGQRDWLAPNARHLRLKLLIRSRLGNRRGLRIADVGCGAGVMTDYLTRYGSVVGIDFSRAAIEAAERCAPRVTFRAGGLEELPAGTYDLITLFDVLEHIPANERPAFVGALAQRLAPEGLLFCSTPYPAATRRRRHLGDPTLQVIDEEVDLAVVVAEAAEAGLQLLSFTAYDVFSGSPEYQAMVFSPVRPVGGAPVFTTRPFRLIRGFSERRAVRWMRRAHYAVRAVLRGRLRTAYWFLTARAPHVNS